MTVLKTAKNAKPIDGIIRAKESDPYRIYKKAFLKGDIDIKIKFPPKVPGVRLILFYAIDPSGPKEPSCGGAEVNLSLPEGDHYKDCIASS